ncbi:hypothetical protein LTR56_027387 [Elasticomyces elasticus]|nr:hypothetical protein LTR56_027387 [Elasticomyces elasticus]KAK4913384.1 hypothetical protein LTR49_018272 [Elasticomyces elasticus]KAK5754590.1 hypothetical protein LTS12_015314 [Elasticomyces elasticus]
MTAFHSQTAWFAKPYRTLSLAFLIVVLLLFTLSQNLKSNGPPAFRADGAPPGDLQATEAKDKPATATLLASVDRVSESPPRWSWWPGRDRNNHALNVEQCDSAFPDLYHEIDRSAAFWRERNGGRKITKDQYKLDWSEDGGISIMIYDQQLYVTYSRGLNDFLHWEERSKATLQNINRAVLTSPDPVPNMEFSVKINDRYGLTAKFPNATTWVFSRNITDVAMKQVWLMPDFNFWSYPRVAGSYADFQRQTLRIGDDFAAKEDKLVWRGTINFNFKLRDALIQQTKHQPWADVRKVAEDSNDEESLRNHISMPDHCKYKYTIHTEGWAWSGRLKYLWYASVVFSDA